MLVTIVWCGLFFVAGLHWFWVMGLGGAGLVGIVAAYEFLPHVRARIERFLDNRRATPSRSIRPWSRSPRAAGSGAGRARGQVKRILPDAHTDFIFAVTAEEFGIVVCLGRARASSPSSCCAASCWRAATRTRSAAWR